METLAYIYTYNHIPIYIYIGGRKKGKFFDQT